MKKINEQQTTEEIINSFLVKIKKNVSNIKQSQKQIVDLINENIQQLQNPQKNILDNKLYIVFYCIFQLKNPKLSEISLQYLDKLISLAYLDVQTYDYIQEINKKGFINPRRRLYETIIDNIYDQASLQIQTIYLQINKVLITLMTCKFIQIHGVCIQKVLNTILDIYKTSKDTYIQNLTKNNLTLIIDTYFHRMEENTRLSEEERQIYRNKKAIGNNYKIEESINISLNSTEFSELQDNIEIITKSYIKKVLNSLIDDVCIYTTKLQELNKNSLNIDDSITRNNVVLEKMQFIPLKCVPLLRDINQKQYSKNIQVNILNEKNNISGKFGWCFICRETANNFCKDTRVSICSLDCKKKHLDEIHRMSKTLQKQKQGQQTGYFSDCLQIFMQLIQLSVTDYLQNQSSDFVDLRVQVIALDQLLSILEKSGAVLLSKKEFQIIIQEYLLNMLLKNCFSEEKTIFTLSLAILVSLVVNFRDNFKQEIETFLENVFMKLLDCNNSNFSHRYFSLKAIGKIFKFPRAVLELFVNYDCTLNEGLIMENIINLLAKISQGKFLKPEYSNIISLTQELILKKLSFECMLELLQSLSVFCEKCINQDDISILSPVKPDNCDEEENNNDLTIYIDNFTTFDKIERQRLQKYEIQKSIQKFNYKPQQGINYMLKTKLIQENNYREIAQFILNNHGIDQEKLGEFFSINQTSNQQILSEFIDLLQFDNMNIQQALRELLSKFQLPKEAQQVDRIIEKFGEKYVVDNPGIYKSASAAYTLSYALIILQTSLHNPSVQEQDRMTFQQFQKLIGGINDGQDLPFQEIESIFFDIKNRQLAIHKAETTRKTLEEAITTNVKEKQDLFKQETQKIIEKGQKIFKTSKDTQYIYVFSNQYVKPFLEMIWSPIFASVTTTIEQSDDLILIENCLQIVVYFIKLLGMFQMSTEKETFVLFLAKSTGLKPIDVKELTQKNIICIKYLIEAIFVCDNYIQGSWKIFLSCISQLDYYNVIKSNANLDLFPYGKQQNEELEVIANKNRELIQLNIDSSFIDRIFHNSDKLNNENILLFIQSLQDLSIDEMSEEHPRTFCMKRIHEVTIFNMERVKLIWKQIWSILSNFFLMAGTHQNTMIAELAVDLLKQLSLKFLMKQELSNYSFQKQFLDPFEQIYNGIKIDNLVQKELILAIVNHIIQMCYVRLRSGWKTIFKIIIRVLQESFDENQFVKKTHFSLIQLCQNILSKTMSENLEYVIEVFEELIQINIKFSYYNFGQIDINIQAIKNLKICIDFLFLNSVLVDTFQLYKTQFQSKQNIIVQECKRILNAKMIPTLIHLAKLVCLDEFKLQKNSSEILFQILTEQKFSNQTWNQLIKEVIIFLFDEIYKKFDQKNNLQEEIYISLKKISQNVFQQIIILFTSNYQVLNQNFTEILNIYQSAFINLHESLAKIASDSLRIFLFDLGDQFDNNQWSQVILLIHSIHQKYISKDILSLVEFEKDFQLNIHQLLEQEIGNKYYKININIQKNVTQCVIEIIFIDLINEILDRFKHKLDCEHLEQLKCMLIKSHSYSQKFNNLIYLRYVLWQNGLMSDMVNLPGLLKHERESFRAIIKIVYQQYIKIDDGSLFEQLIELITEYLGEYIFRHEQFHLYLKDDKIIEDEFKKYLSNLNLQEIERYILSLLFNISQTIFPILESIEPTQIIYAQLQKLTNNLIEISSLNYTRQIQFRSCKGCQNIQNCCCFSPDQFNTQIKKIIKKYFIFLNQNI